MTDAGNAIAAALGRHRASVEAAQEAASVLAAERSATIQTAGVVDTSPSTAPAVATNAEEK